MLSPDGKQPSDDEQEKRWKRRHKVDRKLRVLVKHRIVVAKTWYHWYRETEPTKGLMQVLQMLLLRSSLLILKLQKMKLP